MLCGLDVPTLKNVRISLQTLELLSFPQSRIRFVLNRANSKVGMKEERGGRRPRRQDRLRGAVRPRGSARGQPWDAVCGLRSGLRVLEGHSVAREDAAHTGEGSQEAPVPPDPRTSVLDGTSRPTENTAAGDERCDAEDQASHSLLTSRAWRRTRMPS